MCETTAKKCGSATCSRACRPLTLEPLAEPREQPLIPLAVPEFHPRTVLLEPRVPYAPVNLFRVALPATGGRAEEQGNG